MIFFSKSFFRKFFRKSIPFLFAALLICPVSLQAGPGQYVTRFIRNLSDHLLNGKQVQFTLLESALLGFGKNPHQSAFVKKLRALGVAIQGLRRRSRESDKTTVLRLINELNSLLQSQPTLFEEKLQRTLLETLFTLGGGFGPTKRDRGRKTGIIKGKIKDRFDGEKNNLLRQIESLKRQLWSEKQDHTAALNRLRKIAAGLEGKNQRLKELLKQNRGNESSRNDLKNIQELDRKNIEYVKAISKHEQEMRDSEMNITGLQGRIRELERLLKKQNGAQTGLQKKIQELQAQVRREQNARLAAERELTRLKTQMGGNNRTIAGLRAKLQKSEGEKKLLVEKQKRLEGQLREVNNLLKRKTNEAEKYKKIAAGYEKDLEKLKKQLSDSNSASERELQGLRNKLRNLTCSHKQARVEFDRQREAFTKQIHDLMKILSDLGLVDQNTVRAFGNGNRDMGELLKKFQKALEDMQQEKLRLEQRLRESDQHALQNRELLETLRQLEQQKEELERLIKQLQEQKRTSENQKTLDNKKIEKLDGRLRRSDSDKGEFESRIQNLNQEINKLKGEIESLNKRNCELTDENAKTSLQLKEELRRKTQELIAFKNKVATLEGENQELRNQSGLMKLKFDDAQEQFDNQLKNVRKQLKDSGLVPGDDSQDDKTFFNKLPNRLIELKLKTENLEERLKNAEQIAQENQELKQKLQALEDSEKNLKQKIEDLQRKANRVDNLEGQLRQLQDVQSDNGDLKNKLIQQGEQFENKKSDLDDTIKGLEIEIERLRVNLSGQTQNSEKNLRDQKKKDDEKIKAAESESDNLRKHIGENVGKQQELENKINQLLEQIKDLKGENEHLSIMSRFKKLENGSLKGEINSLKEHLQSLINELKLALEESNGKETEKTKKLKEQIAHLEDHLKKLRELEEQKQRLESENSELKKTLISCKNQIEELQKKNKLQESEKGKQKQKLGGDLLNKEKELGELKNELSKLNQLQKEKDNQLKRELEKNTELTEKIQKLEHGLEKHKTENEKIINKLNQDLEEQKSEEEQWKRNLDLQAGLIRKLNKENSQLKKDFEEKLSGQNMKIRDELKNNFDAELEKQKIHSNDELKYHAKENEDLKKHLSGLNKKLKDDQWLIDELKNLEELKDLRLDGFNDDESVEKKEALQKQIARLNGKRKRQKEEIEYLQKQVADQLGLQDKMKEKLISVLEKNNKEEKDFLQRLDEKDREYDGEQKKLERAFEKTNAIAGEGLQREKKLKKQLEQEQREKDELKNDLVSLRLLIEAQTGNVEHEQNKAEQEKETNEKLLSKIVMLEESIADLQLENQRLIEENSGLESQNQDYHNQSVSYQSRKASSFLGGDDPAEYPKKKRKKKKPVVFDEAYKTLMAGPPKGYKGTIVGWYKRQLPRALETLNITRGAVSRLTGDLSGARRTAELQEKTIEELKIEAEKLKKRNEKYAETEKKHIHRIKQEQIKQEQKFKLFEEKMTKVKKEAGKHRSSNEDLLRDNKMLSETCITQEEKLRALQEQIELLKKRLHVKEQKRTLNRFNVSPVKKKKDKK